MQFDIYLLSHILTYTDLSWRVILSKNISTHNIRHVRALRLLKKRLRHRRLQLKYANILHRSFSELGQNLVNYIQSEFHNNFRHYIHLILECIHTSNTSPDFVTLFQYRPIHSRYRFYTNYTWKRRPTLGRLLYLRRASLTVRAVV